jgi:hypothetical protein
METSCNAAHQVINGPELLGEYLGDSEENLRVAFGNAVQHAETCPTVLFIDEIDAICPHRQRGHGHENRIVAQLLTLMDGHTSRGMLFLFLIPCLFERKRGGEGRRSFANSNQADGFDLHSPTIAHALVAAVVFTHSLLPVLMGVALLQQGNW